MSITYTLQEQPGDFQLLTQAAVHACRFFSLVLREREGSQEALEALGRLREYLVDEQQKSEWPGTVLFGSTASVFTYRLDAGSANVLLGLGSSFSGWLEPRLPEDVGFLRADSSVWLGSVAHERDVFLELSDEEFSMLSSLAPGVAARLRADVVNES
jgi:hypothetical protein